jgi:hypothetical protein
MKKQLTTLMIVLRLATAAIVQDKMKDDQNGPRSWPDLLCPMAVVMSNGGNGRSILQKTSRIRAACLRPLFY